MGAFLPGTTGTEKTGRHRKDRMRAVNKILFMVFLSRKWQIPSFKQSRRVFEKS
jgi:hypothetical protein